MLCKIYIEECPKIFSIRITKHFKNDQENMNYKTQYEYSVTVHS